ncbi:MAG: DUF4465 domain-containing protein [Planctomycetota bacterium]|jgi:hypothetical protein
MSLGRTKFRNLVYLTAVLAMASAANANKATFEDLDLPPESYWNGSDSTGGFTSGSMQFGNNYDATWGSWDGFAYSNITDTTAAGFEAQYNAITGTGQGRSANYAVGYVGWTTPPTVTLNTAGIVDGLYVTNVNYAYYSMLNGDAFAKKFGGNSGNDQDWFKLTITGKDPDGIPTGTVDFYLADYRFADNNAEFGMNTPACFAIDTVEYRSASGYAGPYTEPGVNGYIGDDWRRAAPADDDAVINPIFRGWATAVVSYSPANGVDPQWTDPSMALGPATGDKLDIVSLGDLDQQEISQGTPPGWITLSFDEPIRQMGGYDFVIFENGFVSAANWDTGSIAGEMFAELGYVEVSSNGSDFVRFPAVSLTPGPSGPYSTIEISDVYNLVGKHPNSSDICTGTPFDLQEIANEPNVVSGLVDINDINYVRIVDIPGSGDFYDGASAHLDPNTRPLWDFYTNNHPIHDAWITFGSGGLDVEAVGVLKEQKYSADIDLNGVVDMFDFALFASAWHSHFGRPGWIGRCDLAEPKDLVIDAYDLAVFIAQWLEAEQWRLRMEN